MTSAQLYVGAAIVFALLAISAQADWLAAIDRLAALSLLAAAAWNRKR